MTAEQSPPPRRRYPRRKYLIDKKLQIAVAMQMIAVLVAVGLMHVGAVMLFPHWGSLPALSKAETREIVFRANLLYFILGAAMFWMVAVVIMHRVAGPSMVLKRAIKGLMKREFFHRLTLRKRDYLQDLAASVKKLSEHLQKESEERRQAVRDIENCLDEKDIAGAHELLRRLAEAEGEAKPADGGKPAPDTDDPTTADLAEIPGPQSVAD
jgi:hypothetical protein